MLSGTDTIIALRFAFRRKEMQVIVRDLASKLFKLMQK